MEKSFPCRNLDELGVDINRNYGFKFGIDDMGSSDRHCAEDYRGTGPFSENETKAMRDYVTS